MKTFLTEIRAIDPLDGELKTFGGPDIISLSPKLAENYLQLNGLGYCKVIGELVSTIPCKQGSYEPDFSKKIDQENINGELN